MSAERAKSDKALARTEAQRERILSAAQRCFIEQGFHAAGMARIAEAAGMSPGLIYRYFDNKAAIIRAIIARQLERLNQDISLHRPIDLAAEMTAKFVGGHGCDRNDLSPALLLELSAEATRDPEIHAVVRHFDQNLRDALVQWLMRGRQAGGHDLPEARAREAALLLQLLFEGMKVRQTRDPTLNPALLEASLRRFLPFVLAGGAPAPAG